MKMVINGETIPYSIKKQTDRKLRTRQYYRASIPIRKDPDTGKMIRKEVTAPTEEKLKEKILESIHARPLETGFNITLEQYLQKWIEQNAYRYAPGSVHNIRIYARCMCKEIGSYPLWKLNEEIMNSFYREIIQQHGYCTAFHIHAALSKPFQEAFEKHLIYSNPQQQIHIPYHQKKTIVPLTRDEARQLIALCREDELYGGIIACSLLLGLRISEAIGLSADDYDPEAKTLRIHRQIIQISGREVLENTTKSRRERILPVSDAAGWFLDRQLTLQQQWKKEPGSSWDNEYRCMFTNHHGTHLTHRNVRCHLKKMCTQIGRNNFTFHHLRHTCATIVHLQRDGITIARDILGHKYYQTTSNYIHSTPDQEREALEQVAKYAS